MTQRPIGIAPLSVLGTEPADFIRAAAETGFDFVGLRTRPVTDSEPDFNLLHGNARLQEVLAVLRDTGIKVLDTEFLAINEHTTRADWLPMLDTAQALGAHSLTVTITDPDLTRATDTLAALVEDARHHKLAIALEPISYQTVKQLREGIALAQSTGCTLLFDTLHFHRAGCGLEQITEAAPYLAAPVQLCDGLPYAQTPTRDMLIEESRNHRLIPGEGRFALAECLALCPAHLPVSVEVPNPKFAELGLKPYLAHLKAAALNICMQAQNLAR